MSTADPKGFDDEVALVDPFDSSDCVDLDDAARELRWIDEEVDGFQEDLAGLDRERADARALGKRLDRALESDAAVVAWARETTGVEELDEIVAGLAEEDSELSQDDIGLIEYLRCDARELRDENQADLAALDREAAEREGALRDLAGKRLAVLDHRAHLEVQEQARIAQVQEQARFAQAARESPATHHATEPPALVVSSGQLRVGVGSAMSLIAAFVVWFVAFSPIENVAFDNWNSWLTFTDILWLGAPLGVVVMTRRSVKTWRIVAGALIVPILVGSASVFVHRDLEYQHEARAVYARYVSEIPSGAFVGDVIIESQYRSVIRACRQRVGRGHLRRLCLEMILRDATRGREIIGGYEYDPRRGTPPAYRCFGDLGKYCR